MKQQTKHFYEFGPFRFDLEEHTFETVPKRGFRFVAPVEDLPAGQSEDTGATEISVTAVPIEGKNEAPRHASRFISLILGLVILAVGGMVIVWSKLNNSLPKMSLRNKSRMTGFRRLVGQ